MNDNGLAGHDILAKNERFLNHLFYRSIETDYILELFPSAPKVISVIVFYAREGLGLSVPISVLLSHCCDCIQACGLDGHAFLSGHDYFIFLLENERGGEDTLFHQQNEILKHCSDSYGIQPIHCASGLCPLDDSLGQHIQTHMTTVSSYRYYGHSLKKPPQKSISNFQLQKLLDSIETCCEMGDMDQAVQLFKQAVQDAHQAIYLPMNIKRSALRIMYAFFSINNQRGVELPYYDIPHFIIEQVLKSNTAEKTEQVVDDFCNYVLRKAALVPKTIPEPIKHALEFIHANYQRPIKLKEVASAIHLNKSYLSQLFQKTMGITYSEYLVELRISSAKHYLKTTNKTAAEVAEIVGFSSQNYFTKVFKHSVGVSPIRFRYSSNS